MDFTTILQDPAFRPLVQENLLERAFHDALFPRTLFRAEAADVEWPANVGDQMIFSGVGLIKPNLKPGLPGVDPKPATWASEQWFASLNKYHGTIDTHMPTSIVAIANLFMRNAHQLGLMAAMTLNRIVRNRLYTAALSGWTVVDGHQIGVDHLHVNRLNGFTTARSPGVVGASQVRFERVSGANPLAVDIATNLRNVIGFVPDVSGDEIGPGVLILDAVVTANDRDYVKAADATALHRVGGGMKVDDVGTGDVLKMQDIRAVVANFRQNNVPEQPDGRFHCHFDPLSEAQIYQDDEFQRLLTALPDYYMYRQFAIGEILGCVYFRNSECPLKQTVEPKDGVTYSDEDPFPGELTNNGTITGVPIHRPLFVGQGCIYEYYQDLSQLITEAGVTGRIGEPKVTNNGIEVPCDRVQLIIRAPLNRDMDEVSTTWKFFGDWPVRTDSATGDAARFKRTAVIEHGQAA